MSNPIDPIPLTPDGWPYLPDNAPVADMPIWTQRLTAALAGFTPGSAAPITDTGWLDIPVLAGFTAGTGASAPKARARNGQVYFKGIVTGSFTANVTTEFATAPVGTRPPADDDRTTVAAADWTGTPFYASVRATGRLQANFKTTGERTLALAGYSGYLID